MKLKLTNQLKTKLRNQLTRIVIDVLLDGKLDSAEATRSTLELLAEEIKQQNE